MKLRIALFGSGDFGLPTLSALLERGHDIAAVVTQPARPAGRGGSLRATPLARAAAEANLHVLEIAKINQPDSVEAIRQLNVQAIVVVAYGQLVRAAVRELAPLGAFNLHGSLLPELRGAAPINWAIIRGYRTTGVTTFSLVDAMDAGPMYLQEKIDIDPQDTVEEVKPRLAQIGGELVCRTLDLLASGDARPIEQDHTKATLAPLLKKSDGIIDWQAPAQTISNLVHGTWPWPAAQAVFHGDKTVHVEIARARAVEGEGQPGVLDQDLKVGTGSGRLEILQIQPAGKKVMGWRDFVNGYRVARGQLFGSKMV